jgi:4-azaleucine resistance transporter AzlC
MRSTWRPFRNRGLPRDIAVVCLADAVAGASFGALTVSTNLPLWLPSVLSIVVFAGAAQFVFVGIVASGGNPMTAVAAGLLINARHVAFGFAVGDLLGSTWIRRIAGAHLMVDESVAFALAERDPHRGRIAYWTCGIWLFVCWNIGVLMGALGGTLISDVARLGLDATFPAVLLALVLPSLGDVPTRRAAVVGAAIALVTAPFLPVGLPVLLALAGILTIGFGGDRCSNCGAHSSLGSDRCVACDDRYSNCDDRPGGQGCQREREATP